MSRLAKLIKTICARPPEARFSDVHALLMALGWHVDRQEGSHVTFVKENEYPIVVPIVGGRRVKRVYLIDICERLDLDCGA